MPKLKTNKSAAKRLRRTKKGKFKKRSSGRGHILGKKSAGRKRKLRREAFLSKSAERRAKRFLPYG